MSVALGGTASDVATGNANVVDAEYFLGAPGADGSGTAHDPQRHGPDRQPDGDDPPPGTSRVVSVHSQDAAGNWGPFATINLTVDLAGPATSGVAATPNPNNGSLGQNSSNPSVRVTATFADTASGGSTIAAGEGFIDTVGANGTGFAFAATDGVFNAPSEAGYADIPLTTINQLSTGNHTIYVHGKDAAGNWGATSTTILRHRQDRADGSQRHPGRPQPDHRRERGVDRHVLRERHRRDERQLRPRERRRPDRSVHHVGHRQRGHPNGHRVDRLEWRHPRPQPRLRDRDQGPRGESPPDDGPAVRGSGLHDPDAPALLLDRREHQPAGRRRDGR